MTGRAYGSIVEADVAAVSRLIHHAFAGPMEGCEKWVRETGIEHVRVLRAGESGGAESCLIRLPMGQYFGGRSVPMLGIAGVAVGPESRGRGFALEMMKRCVREAAAEGWPISTLYPSTPGLYRQVGYEQAGHWFITRLPIARIDVRERGPAVRPLTVADEGARRACYSRFARPYSGMLDRGPYCWRRTEHLWGDDFKGFGIEDGAGGLAGYVFLTQKRDSTAGDHDVVLSDLAFTTAAAGRRLAGFLADFATVGNDVVFKGGPLHPLLSLLNARHYKVEKKDYWMVRILDVAKALEARGYAPGVSLSLGLRLEDDVVEGNNGEWTVKIEGGRARVARGGACGSPSIRCHVRGLASIYSGLYTAEQAAVIGWVEGTAEALALAGAAFGGATPWMVEMF